MKKFLAAGLLLLCMVVCVHVHAESEERGYIVKLKEPAVSLMTVTDEVTQIGESLYRADDLDAVYSVIPEENIETVFPDYEFELFDLDYPEITSDFYFEDQWYLDAIGARAIREKGLSGEGVKIAIVDSGITSSHPDFDQSNILQGYNCTYGAVDKNDYSDTVGHGTMVAGVIAAQTDNECDISGIASNAQLIPIKITDSNSLNMSSIFLGLEQALKTDCDIINMSFGGAITDQDALAVLKSYIDEAEEKGMIVVAAVGNSGHTNNLMNYPAGFENVIGVGAVDEDLSTSYFSQRNESVFLSAPGNSIVSLYKNKSVTTGLGTSLSAPIVTAVTAIIKEVHPDYSLQEVKELLKKTATDRGVEGYDINYGHGVLNAENIVEELSADLPEFIISQGKINSQKRIHVHNNSSDAVTANAYFASYGDYDSLEGHEMMEEIDLACGVTNIVNDKLYQYFFLWDEEFRPFVKKYAMK